MHTVVIGGGIIGLTTAYQLAKEGESVTLVDARATGLGAAEVNAGWVVPADSLPLPGPGAVVSAMKWMTKRDSPLYIKPSIKPSFLTFMLGMFRASNAKDQRAGFAAHLALMGDSISAFDDYRADGIDFELKHNGLLMAFHDDAHMHLHLGYADLTGQYGIAPIKMLGDDVRVHEPLLKDGVRGGLFFPKELHLDPRAFGASLHAKLVEMGVEIVENAPIDKVQRAGDRIVSVSSGSRTFPADNFLLAAGAWTGPVSKLFGADLPIRPGKGYSVEMSPYGLKGATNLYDAKVAVTPFEDRLRLAGTMEFGGLDENINRVRVDAILRAPLTYLRDWEPPAAADVRPQAGMRPVAPDGLPVMGRLPRLANAYVAGGHGMYGVTLAPATARAMSTLIREGVLDPVLLPFSPARFRGGR
ncbi:amino acid dehydrogenase [Microbacterium mangrovi]|uniref:Amino acid dehydrogenase n=1 Tax=Microbacterium mangrovi TaxID=1348253 RepID=A0A0B2A6X7_9MICO|nr:FAD-dependent oxidoreductase [Microbacterium mangrovi]KHK98830.1 amino acid dehydrogenase [Microbacterium mangrovi]